MRWADPDGIHATRSMILGKEPEDVGWATLPSISQAGKASLKRNWGTLKKAIAKGRLARAHPVAPTQGPQVARELGSTNLSI